MITCSSLLTNLSVMKVLSLITILTTLSVLSSSCAQKENPNKAMKDVQIADGIKTDTATFGTGCFWCTEAIFEQLDGVMKVTSGYSNGHVKNPTYKEVCEGETGHAECVQVQYEPGKITYDELLEV